MSSRFGHFNIGSLFRSRVRFVAPLALTILIALLAFFPPDLANSVQPTLPLGEGRGEGDAAVLLPYPVGLQDAGARCPNACVIQVCTRWVPEGHPQCPVGGAGGGCCLAYGQDCDPNCTEPDPDQPPTISASQNCSAALVNGWCAVALTLDLSASDPQGQTIQISGDVDGTPFACAAGATSCGVPLPEGSGTVNYLVTSATGLTDSGSQSYQRDATAPDINGTLSGAAGADGWFVSVVDASAAATDAVSGVSSFSVSVNGGAWTNYSGPVSLSDGQHTVKFRAIDAAGNQNQITQTVKLDTLTPSLDLTLRGAVGEDGWYVSSVQADIEGNDDGSGLAQLEYALDGGSWTSYQAPITLLDGGHSLQVRAIDAAGNETLIQRDLAVDTVTPSIALTVNGTGGSGGWYVSSVRVSAAGSDGGSGLASMEFSIDGGAWTTYSAPLVLDDGHTLRFRAADNAGNTTVTPAQAYRIDVTPPRIELPDLWNLGEDVEYEVSDPSTGAGQVQSGVASVRIVIEDDRERFEKLTWYGDPIGDIPWDGRFADGVRAPDGEYVVTIKAADAAGNESVKTALVTVENNLLMLLLPPFAPPPSTPTAEQAPPVDDESSLFGGEQNEGVVATSSGLTAGGVATLGAATGAVDFASEQSASRQSSAANGILWGAMAAAAIGMFSDETRAQNREKTGYAARIAAGIRAKLAAGWLDAATDVEAADIHVLNKEARLEAELWAQSISSQGRPQSAGHAARAGVRNSAGLGANDAAKSASKAARSLWQTLWQGSTSFVQDKLIDPIAGIFSANPTDAGKGAGHARRVAATGTLGALLVAFFGLAINWILRPPQPSAAAQGTAIARQAGTQAVLLFAQTVQAIQTAEAAQLLSLAAPQCTDAYCVGDELYTDGGLNIRTGAGLRFDVSEMLYCGASVKIVEVGSQRDGDGYLWARVQTQAGAEGWAAVSILDKSAPPCSGQASTNAQTLGGTSALMRSASLEGGHSWSSADRHFGVDLHSFVDPTIYSPFDDKVVSRDDCGACISSGGAGGNTTGFSNPMEKKFNYGYGAMAVMEYPYEKLTADQIAALGSDGIELQPGQSLYLMQAHLVPGSAPEAGTELSAGEVAATMGDSGNSHGSHLHLEAAVTTSGIDANSGESTYSYWIRVAGGQWDRAGTRVDPTLLVTGP